MRISVTIFFVFISFCLDAQQPEMVVYYAKGEVFSAATKTKLKKGALLKLNDVIEIGSRSEAVLVCRNAKAIKVSEKGKHRVKDMLMSCNKTETSFTSSYFNYVWEELTHPHGSIEQDPTHYMKNSGSVSRGCDAVSSKLSLDTIYYAQGNLPLYFKTTYPKPHITFFMNPEEGEIILTKPMQHLSWNVSEMKHFEKGTIYWQVTDEYGNGCERNVLTVLDKKEYAGKVSELLRSVPFYGSAADRAFQSAFILEENHFLVEAFNFYKAAAKADPSNKIYKSAESRFYE